MNLESRFSGTLHTISTHWPLYLFVYGGGIALLLFALAFAVVQQWWGLLALIVALLLVLSYFLGASLWAAYEQYDIRSNQAAHIFFEMGRLRPTDRLLHVGLGRRRTPIRLSRRLTSGHLTTIDVYNPQQAPDRALVRARHTSPPSPDPRRTWLDGTITLLPLPNGSVPQVTLDRTLHHLWEHGDRLLLLREIWRVLQPGGQLLLAEPTRTRTNILLLGPAALSLQPVTYWRGLLESAGFHLKKEQDVRGLVHFFRVQKPLPGEMQQLTFDFGP